MRDWSNDSETTNKFNESFRFANRAWELAFLYLSNEGKKDEDKALIKRIGKSDRYILAKKCNYRNNDYIAQKYDQFDDFDELIGLMKTLNITLN